MGLGLHGGGLSATNWLTMHGAHVLVTDLRSRAILAPSIRNIARKNRVQLVLGRHRLQDFRSADLVVQNPGVPATSPYIAEARSYGIPVVNEATLFFLHCPCPVIGITGTKGKSTTSALLFAMLKKKYGKRVHLAGNIRTSAMLDIVDTLTSQSLVVTELSSWQLEGLPVIRQSPHVALVTNLLDDHLDRYPSRAAYFRAKSLIWRWQNSDDLALLNADNTPSRNWKRKPKARVMWFSGKRWGAGVVCGISNGHVVLRNGKRQRNIIATKDSTLRGAHATSIIVPAVLIAHLYHVSIPAIRSVLRSFQGLPGRLEPVKKVRGVEYMNDTTATTPVAAQSALASFPRKVILIAGGMNKKTPYNALAVAIRKKVKHLVLLPGTGSDELTRLLKGWKHIHPAGSMHQAVTLAHALARSGDTVVLSPAGSSFNLFLHEFDRGEQFIAAVRQLK